MNTKMLHRIYQNLLKAKTKEGREKHQFGVTVTITVKKSYNFDEISGNRLWENV